MSRGYAIGLGAATQMLTLILAEIVAGPPNELTHDSLMALSWVINLAVAEWAIRKRHAPRGRTSMRPTTRRRLLSRAAIRERTAPRLRRLSRCPAERNRSRANSRLSAIKRKVKCMNMSVTTTYAKLSVISITVTAIITAVHHIYREGWMLLIPGALVVLLPLVLMRWFSASGSNLALSAYGVPVLAREDRIEACDAGRDCDEGDAGQSGRGAHAAFRAAH